MNETPTRENFELHLPEAKLELLDGRLLIGNGLAGSRLLLAHVLRGWGLDAAIAFGAVNQWPMR